jgi:hypothetical protein
VLTALKANPKVRGWGVDINPGLVAEANANAREQGLADRAQFFHRRCGFWRRGAATAHQHQVPRAPARHPSCRLQAQPAEAARDEIAPVRAQRNGRAFARRWTRN